MSLENLKEYARRCATEPELRDKAREVGMTNVEEHMRQAGSMGLDWTPDDMVAFRKEVIDAHGEIGELSEDELEQVAGGIVTTTAAIAAGVAVGVGAGVGAVIGGIGAGVVTAVGKGGW